MSSSLANEIFLVAIFFDSNFHRNAIGLGSPSAHSDSHKMENRLQSGDVSVHNFAQRHLD